MGRMLLAGLSPFTVRRDGRTQGCLTGRAGGVVVLIRAVMDQIITKAGAEGFSHAYTNIVCCVPHDPEDHAKVIPPHAEAIAACRPRLQQFIALCQPRLVMAVGHYSRCELVEMREAGVFSAPVANMIHPGAI